MSGDTEQSALQIERDLVHLRNQMTPAVAEAAAAEAEYAEAKALYTVELGITRIRLKLDYKNRGEKATVQDLDDEALAMCADEYQRLVIAEGRVKIAKLTIHRLEMQGDIQRTIAAGFREAIRMT